MLLIIVKCCELMWERALCKYKLLCRGCKSDISDNVLSVLGKYLVLKWPCACLSPSVLPFCDDWFSHVGHHLVGWITSLGEWSRAQVSFIVRLEDRNMRRPCPGVGRVHRGRWLHGRLFHFDTPASWPDCNSVVKHTWPWSVSPFLLPAVPSARHVPVQLLEKEWVTPCHWPHSLKALAHNFSVWRDGWKFAS